MVRAVTSLGNSGLSDWLIQRVSSVVLAAYFAVILVYIIANPGLGHAQWAALFGGTAMRVFSMLALLSLISHTWIGLWSVLTDYVTERLMGPKGNGLRLLLQLACGLVLFFYLIWGIQILWGF